MSRSYCCPACGSVMYPARLLKGYDKTGEDADCPTCALHGPLGRFRHIATDRGEGRCKVSILAEGWDADPDWQGA